MVISTRARPPRREGVVYTHITTRDYLNTLFFYRKIAFMVFVWTIVIGTVIGLMQKPQYRAEARLLTLLAGYYNQSSVNDGTTSQPVEGQLVSIEAQILNSSELHRAVLKTLLGPNATRKQMSDELLAFEKHFHLQQDDLASTISLFYTDTNPKRAADMLNRILAEYFLERAAIFTSGRVSSLAERRDVVRAQLDKLNANMVAFQTKYGIVSIEDQIAHAVALQGLIRQRKLENNGALAQDRSSLASLLTSAKDVPATILLFSDNGEAARTLDTMQLSQLQLEARRADLASRYMKSSPFVKQIDRQIKALRVAISQQKEKLIGVERYGHNAYYDTVQDRLSVVSSNIKGEIARQKELDDQLKLADAGLQSLIGAANELSQMQTDRNILTESLRSLSRQVELASIDRIQADSASSTNVRVIQAPFPPAQPINPLSMFIAASVVAGIVLPALTILVLVSLRETFLSPEQVERVIALPVLSAPVTPRAKSQRRWLGLRRKKPEATKLPGTYPSRILYGRTITAIDTSSDALTKLVMMVSFNDNEGLLEIVQGLAAELERRSSRPILVLDMASTPDAPPLYGIPNDNGELPWLFGDGESRSDTPAPEEDALKLLEFLPVAGHDIMVARPREGTLTLTPHETTTLFDTLRARHDYVVVHAPPVSRSFIGVENARLADATILAVRAEKTRKPVVLGLKEQIQEAGGWIVGVVLTHRKSYIPAFVYRFL
ncbi:GumC family protein [Acetobacter papayae]|uniref:GumC family protein n=1 Tax=Acetobacter papayae TaxID=1076592 RepID=UPI0039EB4955